MILPIFLSCLTTKSLSFEMARKTTTTRTTEAHRSIEEVVVSSLSQLTNEEVDWNGVSDCLKSCAYGTHKEWSKTRASAEELGPLISGEPRFREMFERVLIDGGWDDAPSQEEKPWAVLVAGLNGIRKTSAMYEPWMPQVLRECLAGVEDVPTGSNSFFRQLDFVMATVANDEFFDLYSTDAALAEYAAKKADIFAKYRTVAEVAGIVLVEEAKRHRKNVILETSGRDVGMFDYVDANFGQDYRKLVIYFDINDVQVAKDSVDARMKGEMVRGRKARDDPRQRIYANAGGPYGPDALDGVYAQSKQVWADEVLSGNVGSDWYKAVVKIDASDPAKWTCQADASEHSTTSFPFTDLGS